MNNVQLTNQTISPLDMLQKDGRNVSHLENAKSLSQAKTQPLLEENKSQETIDITAPRENQEPIINIVQQ